MMRRLLTIVILLSSIVFAHADDGNNRLYQVASSAHIKKDGRLELMLYLNTRVWLNGIRVSTRNTGGEPDPWPVVAMKPGDVLTFGDGLLMRFWHPEPGRTFEQYRLDHLTPEKAYFTQSTFAAVVEKVGENTSRYRPGKLKLVCRFEVVLKDFYLIYEELTPGVLVGELHNQRSK